MAQRRGRRGDAGGRGVGVELVLRFGEATRTARVERLGERWVVRLDGGSPVEVDARRLADGTWRLRLDGAERTLRAAACADRAGRHLWLEGRTMAYARVEDAASRGSGGGGVLGATIPSVVLEVLVAPGDVVAEGDRLLLLESMKMVMPVVAPRDGVVAAVRCRAGEAVAPGIALVELTDAAPGAGAP